MQLKEELIEYGYIRRKGPTGKKQKITSHPFHYRSSEGFDIYVGKNNFQNEELSFKFASGNDWWFHAGFVVYYTNYSMMAEPNIRNLQEVQD